MSEIKKTIPNVTSIDKIMQWVDGEIVELPGWKSDEPVYFKLSRPSLLALAKAGKIPNSLLARASELFYKGTRSLNVSDTEMLAESYDIMHVLAASAMKEPTMDELEERGVELTDAQYIAIFQYTQNGINALSQFRGKQPNSELAVDLA